jgi:hypothetical protein
MGATGLQIAQSGTPDEARGILGINDFIGATAGTDGEAGRVPQPDAGEQGLFLRGDGTWAAAAVVTATLATTSEALAGTDNVKYISPLTGNARAAVGEAPRLPVAGLHFANTGAIAPAAVPAGPKFIRVNFVMPSVASGFTAARIARIDAGSVNGAFEITDPDSSANLAMRTYGATSGDYRTVSFTGIKTAYAGQDVWLTIVSNGASRPKIYVNMTEWTSFSSDATTGTAPADWSGFESMVATQLLLSGPNAFRGTMLGAEVGNVALTATEVAALFTTGWAAEGLKQYVHATGAGRTLISPSVKNGGFETLGGGGLEVFADWRNGTNITVVEETSDVYAGTKSAKLTGAGGISSSANNWLKASTTGTSNAIWGSPYDYGKAFRRTFAAKHLSGGSLQAGSGFATFRTITSGEAAAWTLFTVDYIISGSITTGAPSPNFGASTAAEWLLDEVTEISVGLCGRWVFDRNSGYCYRDLSGARNPLVLSVSTTPPGVQALIEGADIIAVPIPVMSADGFIHGDRVIVPAGYEPYAASLTRESGASTGTVTIKKTSSGGTTLFTGTLAASVSLTPTIVAFTAADKLHLSNTDWASSTLRGVVWCRRIS